MKATRAVSCRYRIPPSFLLPSSPSNITSHHITSVTTGVTERGPGELNEEISVAVRNGQAAWAVEDDVDGPRFCWPAWVTTTLEISGVVAAWTGVEW